MYLFVIIFIFFILLDKSVLENHHIAASWLVTMSEEKYNIFEKLDKDDYKKIRERMISMVLATDMSFHFSDMAKLKARLASSGYYFNYFLFFIYIFFFII